jgi:hypothetical protein
LFKIRGAKWWIKQRTETLDIDEVDVVRGGVDHGPESHRVGNLTMEPDVLVCRERPGELGADDTDDVPEHGHQDQATIEGEDKTSATGGPDGPLETVKDGELLVRSLERKKMTGVMTSSEGGRRANRTWDHQP